MFRYANLCPGEDESIKFVSVKSKYKAQLRLI